MAKSKKTIADEKIQSLEKQAYRPREFQRAYGIAKSYFYEQIAQGRLKIIKAGKATLVTREAANEWLALCATETQPKRAKRGG